MLRCQAVRLCNQRGLYRWLGIAIVVKSCGGEKKMEQVNDAIKDTVPDRTSPKRNSPDDREENEDGWSDFIGSIAAETDLSTNYKTYLKNELDPKYGYR